MATDKVRTSDQLDSLVISAEETILGERGLKRIAALVVDDEMDVGPALGEFVERGANLARAAAGAPIWRADVHRERHEEGLTTSYFFVGAKEQIVDAVRKVLAEVAARRGGKGRRSAVVASQPATEQGRYARKLGRKLRRKPRPWVATKFCPRCGFLPHQCECRPRFTGGGGGADLATAVRKLTR